MNARKRPGDKRYTMIVALRLIAKERNMAGGRRRRKRRGIPFQSLQLPPTQTRQY